MVECPTCGEDKFSRRQSMKAHHARVHGESIAGEPVECDYCGETVRKHPSRIERQDKHFCNDKCQGAWMAEQPPENSPAWKGGKVEVECEWCGDTKPVIPARAKRTKRFFCGGDCRGAWMSHHIVGENHPNWAGGHVTIECAVCGTKKERTPARVNAAGRNFCSSKCVGRWLSETRVGESHPLWQGGRAPYYGENWYRQRRGRLELDDYTCVVCGTHESDMNREPDVHHIQPIRTFDQPEDANTMDNLITLCQTCHAKWEGIPLRPEV